MISNLKCRFKALHDFHQTLPLCTSERELQLFRIKLAFRPSSSSNCRFSFINFRSFSWCAQIGRVPVRMHRRTPSSAPRVDMPRLILQWAHHLPSGSGLEVVTFTRLMVSLSKSCGQSDLLTSSSFSSSLRLCGVDAFCRFPPACIRGWFLSLLHSSSFLLLSLSCCALSSLSFFCVSCWSCGSEGAET